MSLIRNVAYSIIVLSSIFSISIQQQPQQQQHQQQQHQHRTGNSVQQRGIAPTIWLNARVLPHAPSEKLAAFLDRVGPNMRASTNYHDYNDIGLNESIEAWRIMHEQARFIAKDQVTLHRSHIVGLVHDANVSKTCENSIKQLLDSMERLDSWAIEMWSSTSNFPPVGLADGYVTDLGSYRGCIDIKPPTNRLNFTHTNYCLVAFRPILPARPRFHSVFKNVNQDLINQFNKRDFFYSLALRAQYSYYLYRKSGVCVPFSCTPGDIQNVSKTIARRLALVTGPVKCFTRAPPDYQIETIKTYIKHEQEEITIGKIENEPILIQLNRSLNNKQLISLGIISLFFAIVFLSTFWHALELIWAKMNQFELDYSNDYPTNSCKSFIQNTLNQNSHHQNVAQISPPLDRKRKHSLLFSNSSTFKYIAFYYFSLISNGQDFFNTSMRSNEIKCLHGFRVITMFWIICVHTLQYNEWSGFTRVYESEISLKDPIMQPMINANHVVDNFFLMSGLLAAYTTLLANKNSLNNFSIMTSLLARYLRLTPQVLLLSLLYILLPLAGDGPFWYDMTHDAAKYCEKNWWVNLLHLQAFYRDNEMCNLVGWWISVDMFYYILALILLWMILKGKPTRAAVCSIILVTYCMGASAYRHYKSGFTPNNLANVPQIGEVWTEYVVLFNWSPYPHAYVFFLGLWIGYILVNNKWRNLVQRWSGLGWAISILSLILVNYSTHIWISGTLEPDIQIISTSYNIISIILWANAFGWIIVALHYGCLPCLSRLMSTNFCVRLSKASFIIYLSHMLLIRLVFGKQHNTLEVSTGSLIYIMIGNIFVSVLLGVFLCIAFEGPCMKFQRIIIAKFKPSKPIDGSYLERQVSNHEQLEKISLNYAPTTVVLLK